MPPVISDELVDPEPRIIKGQTATLDCPVYGIPFPNITWFRDGLDLLTSDHRIKVIDNGLQLQILSAMEADTGKYMCVAENPAGVDRAHFNFMVLGEFFAKAQTDFESAHPRSCKSSKVVWVPESKMLGGCFFFQLKLVDRVNNKKKQ